MTRRANPAGALSRVVDSLGAVWDGFERWVYDYFGRGPIRTAMRAVYLATVRHHAVDVASAMAFDLFLALIPLLALTGWVLSSALQADAHMLHNISRLLNLAPEDVQRVVNQHAERFLGGSLAPVALLGALWLASGAFNTAMAAFERSLPGRERAWWHRRAVAILCVLLLLGSVCLGAWVSTLLAGGLLPLLRVLPESADTDAPERAGLVVSFVMTALMVAGFFRIGVRRDGPSRYVWPGTLLTLGIGALASYLFAEYARSLARYAFYYGSLAAVAVLLAWLWMCSLALLLGAELNGYLEDRAHSASGATG